MRFGGEREPESGPVPELGDQIPEDTLISTYLHIYANLHNLLIKSLT